MSNGFDVTYVAMTVDNDCDEIQIGIEFLMGCDVIHCDVYSVTDICPGAIIS